MITIFFCIRRKPSLTQQEFLDHWQNVHAPIVVRHAHSLGIVRYVQQHGVYQAETLAAQQQRGLADPFDGVALISFADWETLKRGLLSPDMAHIHAELMADEMQFVDHPRSTTFFTESVEFEIPTGNAGL